MSGLVDAVAALEVWVLERCAERLDVPASQLDPDVPFAALGLDSLSAVALTGELADHLGIELDPLAVWEHPTAEALASHADAVHRRQIGDARGD